MDRAKRNKRRQAKKCVDAIVSDLTDRRGLRQEWERIDDEIRREIVATWRQIVLNTMAEEDAGE